MYHEIGHHIHQMSLPNGTNLAYINDTEVEKWLGRNKSSFLNVKNKDGLLSRYAAKDQFEWFCENFSEYFMGGKNKVAPQAMSLIESLLLKGDVSNA